MWTISLDDPDHLCSSAANPFRNQAGGGPGGVATRQGINGLSAGHTPGGGEEVADASRTSVFVHEPFLPTVSPPIAPPFPDD